MLRRESRGVAVSDRERIAHVLRRLSMGPQPDLAATLKDSDAAIARALDLSAPAATPPAIAPPPDYDTAQAAGALEQPITFWLQQMQSSPTARRRTARVVLARPLRVQRGEGARSVHDVAAAPAAAQARNRQLRRAAARGVEGSRDALVPRRRHQHRARAERELRARSDGAVHDRSWATTRSRTWSRRRARSPVGR